MKQERLAVRLDDAYEHEELAASLEVIERRLRRRRAIRRSGVALAAMGTAIALAVWAAREPAPPSALTLADGRPLTMLSAPATAQLSDGSAIALASAAHIDAVEQTERAIVLRLASGSARFDVRPHGDREWSVVAGPLTVRVLGTAFTVTRDGPHASVTVHRGVVAVETGAESRRLYAGERFEVGALEPAMHDPLAADVARSDDLRSSAQLALGASRAQPSPERTPPVAQRGAVAVDPPRRGPGAADRSHPSAEPSTAPSLEPTSSPATPPSTAPGATVDTTAAPSTEPLEESEPEPGPETVEVLLARADRARREGRAPDAIEALTSIVSEHPSAPEAPSAAVTLAQLEERRGRLDRAVLAYRRALALGPPPSLAELCYERLVRTHLARNDRAEALDARAEHRRRFPHGARAHTIDALLDPR